jgi:hypothetical protein
MGCHICHSFDNFSVISSRYFKYFYFQVDLVTAIEQLPDRWIEVFEEPVEAVLFQINEWIRLYSIFFDRINRIYWIFYSLFPDEYKNRQTPSARSVTIGIG